MFDLSTRVRAYRNFLLHDTGAMEARRVLVIHDAEGEHVACGLEAASHELPVTLGRRMIPDMATASELIPLLKELTADVGEADALILIMSNSFCMKLMSAPDVHGIAEAFEICGRLPGIKRGGRIDPIAEETFIRLYVIDFGGLAEFNRCLRSELEQAQMIHVTCPLGTDVNLVPRHWLDHCLEILTAPVEDSTQGRIVYCSLADPEEPALIATVHLVCVTELQSARGAGEVTESLRQVLESGEPCVRVVAELGIGTNPGARLTDSFPGQMENEKIRGTCHFDLGHNTWFGGKNVCEKHIGGIVWHPTISGESGAIV